MSVDILTTYARYRPTGMYRRLDRAITALGSSGLRVGVVSASPSQLRAEWLHLSLLRLPRVWRRRNPDHTTPTFWLWFLLRASWRCLVLAQRHRPSCLLAFGFGAAYPLLLAHLLFRIPLLLFARSDEQKENRLNGVSWPLRAVSWGLQWLTCHMETGIIPVSETLAGVLANSYGRNLEGKMRVLPNDIPSADLSHADARCRVMELVGRDCCVLATAGRITANKNVGLIIRALAQASNVDTCLLVVGDGPMLPALRRLAAKLGVENRVIFTGWRDDSPSLVAGADLFVLASFTEGMSNALLDAMGAGVPAILSRIPQHAELIGEDDAMFDSEEESELPRRIRMFAAEPEYKRRLADASLRESERLRFDWDAELVGIVSRARRG